VNRSALKSPVGRGAVVFFVAALAFLGFYGKAYFSDDFRGMLGYELKDTLAHLSSHLRAVSQGATLYWDPDYLQYTPRMPQVPLQSPITLLILAVHRAVGFPDSKMLFIFLLALLALIQVFCVFSMYLLLRYFKLGLIASVTGGLIYAFNQQTLVFGIRHGYERISAILLVPLVLLSFFKTMEEGMPPARRRVHAALAALLLGIAFTANGDVKPTFYFCIFMVIAVFFLKPFRARNVAVLLLIFILAGGIFLVQAMPTYYALREMARGQESLASIMEYSVRPAKFLLTHISTNFTDCPAYPWENTVEFSLSMFLLVILGFSHLSHHRLRGVIAITALVCFFWIAGKYTPLAPLLGNFMKMFSLRHPGRMAILLYFVYAFLAAWGLQSLGTDRFNRIVAAGLGTIPLAVLALFVLWPGKIPARYVLFLFLSYLLLFSVIFGMLKKGWLWLLLVFFILERAVILSSLEGATVSDPTEYYGYDEIYRVHPRVRTILDDPAHSGFRAFFGVKDIPGLFSHNFYLNALSDKIRPIFPYFYFDEELLRVRQMQEVIFADWANPMWDLLNVKYLVDLDGYFAAGDEEDTSKKGLEHLQVVDGHVRENPGVEKEVFVRYRTELMNDETFLKGLAAGELDVKKVAYLNDTAADLLIEASMEVSGDGPEISVVGRKTDEMVADVTVPRPAIVIFSEYWFFPWRAELDGQAVPLLRAYNILQGVKVPAGNHRVRFYFDSRHWKFVVPFLISYGLMLFLIIYIVYWLFKSRKKSSCNS